MDPTSEATAPLQASPEATPSPWVAQEIGALESVIFDPDADPDADRSSPAPDSPDAWTV